MPNVIFFYRMQNIKSHYQKPVTIAVFVIAIIAILIYLAYTRGLKQTPLQGNEKKVQVVASFYPLADFTKNIGGDYVEIKNITPAGSEPHDYEPTPQDIVAVYNAKLFIYNGNRIDAWADKIVDDLKKQGVTVIKMSEYVESLKIMETDSELGEYDPHFWLDSILVQTEVDAIADALIAVDGEHKDEYLKNKEKFKNELSLLDQEFRSGLARCKLHEIITSHNAFSYLARRYSLSTLYILGLSPDEEPSSGRIAQIADIAREKNITHIFFETLLSPKLANTIATEIGAKALVLNPIEGLTDQEIGEGKDYISVMRDNLTNLKIALQCQ